MDSTAESETPPFDIGAMFGGAPDAAPADRRGRGRPRGASKAQRIHTTLVTYHTLAGMGVGRLDMRDGAAIVASGTDAADAWLAWGRADPRVMRALEIATISGPFIAVAMVYTKLLLSIAEHHDISPMSLFKSTPTDGADSSPVSTSSAAHQPAPMAYQPAGPNAPIDTKAPPVAPASADEIRVWPDMDLPHDAEIALRQLARQSGRPYNELRQETLVALAQAQMQQNGHTVQAGALGAPIAAE